MKQGAETKRIISIDVLRGFIMALMALDHVRDFWFRGSQNPTHLVSTTAGLFMTRWITHLCAPFFFLLSGVGIYLSLKQGKSKAAVSRFLLIRGILLIVIEITIFSKLWTGEDGVILLQVLWALGCSMIVMAGLIWLKDWMIGVFALLQILGHNLLGDSSGLVWAIFHQSHTNFEWASHQVIVLYPLIPWMGVMALGYLLGRHMQLESSQRKKGLFGLGAFCLIAFTILRYSNIYGDPVPWLMQRSDLFTVFSFINCEKYPPSLLFLAMTLGTGFLLWGLIEVLISKGFEKWLYPFLIFGRVPLFFYLIHLPFILFLKEFTASDGVGLSGVYGVWFVVMITLFPICIFYQKIKASHWGSLLHYI